MEKTNCEKCGMHKEAYKIFKIKCPFSNNHEIENHKFTLTRIEAEKLNPMYISAGKLLTL